MNLLVLSRLRPPVIGLVLWTFMEENSTIITSFILTKFFQENGKFTWKPNKRLSVFVDIFQSCTCGGITEPLRGGSFSTVNTIPNSESFNTNCVCFALSSRHRTTVSQPCPCRMNGWALTFRKTLSFPWKAKNETPADPPFWDGCLPFPCNGQQIILARVVRGSRQGITQPISPSPCWLQPRGYNTDKPCLYFAVSRTVYWLESVRNEETVTRI